VTSEGGDFMLSFLSFLFFYFLSMGLVFKLMEGKAEEVE